MCLWSKEEEEGDESSSESEGSSDDDNDEEHKSKHCRDILKVIDLTREGINCVQQLGREGGNNIIALGCVDGSVRFFDKEYRIVGWLDDIGDEVVSVSFPYGVDEYISSVFRSYPPARSPLLHLLRFASWLSCNLGRCAPSFETIRTQKRFFNRHFDRRIPSPPHVNHNKIQSNHLRQRISISIQPSSLPNPIRIYLKYHSNGYGCPSFFTIYFLRNHRWKC